MSDDHWAPRSAFLAPIPELDQAADLLSTAVDRLLAGDREQAHDLLLLANMPKLRTFTASAMSQVTTEIHRLRAVANLPPKLAIAARGKRMPRDAEKDAIFRRDGFRCRYCSCRIVLPKAQAIIAKSLPGAVSWGNRDIHLNAAFYTLKGVLDHVVPHAHGGGSSADNLVTCCQPCNYGKGNWFLEEVGLQDPRLRAPILDAWDGLGRVLSLREGMVKANEVTPLTDRTIQKETLVKTQRHRTSRRPSIEEWLHTMNDSDRLQVQALLDILGGCKEFGLSISVQGILSINVAKGRGFVTALGILKDGEVQIPWYAADEKAAFRPFAEILSNNIPEAEFYETAKMWRVRIHDRQVRIGELVQARAAIRSAFEALYAALSSPK